LCDVPTAIGNSTSLHFESRIYSFGSVCPVDEVVLTLVVADFIRYALRWSVRRTKVYVDLDDMLELEFAIESGI
jgi:hypothetical protein